MTEYIGELGTYEQGQIVTVQANSPEEAYDLLVKKLPVDPEYCDEDPENQYVAQIRIDNKCVYDYMNGFELYK